MIFNLKASYTPVFSVCLSSIYPVYYYFHELFGCWRLWNATRSPWCNNQSTVGIGDQSGWTNCWCWTGTDSTPQHPRPHAPTEFLPLTGTIHHCALRLSCRRACCHRLMRIKVEFDNPTIWLVIRTSICSRWWGATELCHRRTSTTVHLHMAKFMGDGERCAEPVVLADAAASVRIAHGP